MAFGNRMLKVELSGPDRPGIIRELSANLAERGVSINDLHTEILPPAESDQHVFRVKALLVVPENLADGALRKLLENLASQMMMDVALDNKPA
jgi:glycine cleavage system regulatory protein